MPCKAQEAMYIIESKGFAPHWASVCCRYKGGVIIFGSDEEDPPKRALWLTYKFEDGSMMNIHDRGCTVFYPGEKGVECTHLPPFEVKRLY